MSRGMRVRCKALPRARLSLPCEICDGRRVLVVNNRIRPCPYCTSPEEPAISAGVRWRMAA
jgi:hypothetical protein